MKYQIIILLSIFVLSCNNTPKDKKEKFQYMKFGPKCSMYTDFTGQEVSQSYKEKIEKAINNPDMLIYF